MKRRTAALLTSWQGQRVWLPPDLPPAGSAGIPAREWSVEGHPLLVEDPPVAVLGAQVERFAAAVAVTMAAPDAGAQVELRSYADAKGFLDVQKLTCAQLANTYQEDADLLMAWYSGWYNGLAKKHYMDIRKGKVVEHEVIMYCKANPEKRIIEAIAVVFKDERAKLGIHMK